MCHLLIKLSKPHNPVMQRNSIICSTTPRRPCSQRSINNRLSADISQRNVRYILVMSRGGAAPAETADFSGLMNVRATAGQRASIQFMNFIAEHVGLARLEHSVVKNIYAKM